MRGHRPGNRERRRGRASTGWWVLPIALAGCGYAGTGPSTMPPGSAARLAASAPARLEPVDPALRHAPADTLAGGGCLTPMVDPEDGARLILVRSGVSEGDYALPDRRYGAEETELLRVECNTGNVLGLVRR